MTQRVRTRKWPTDHGVIGIRETGPVIISPIANYETCGDATHKGPPYLTGGPLSISKSLLLREWTIAYSSHPLGTSTFYEGRFTCSEPGFSFPSPTDLNGWGALGWNRALPIRDVGGIALFLGELKDAPRLLGSLSRFFLTFKRKEFRNRSAEFWADMYLSYQFGVAPMVRDLIGLLDLGSRADEALSKLIARNRKPIRRRFTMDETSLSQSLGTTSIISGGLIPVISSFCYGGPSQLRCFTDRLDSSRRISFAGKFAYYFTDEELSNPKFRSDLRDNLMGMPDLNVLYNLIPWTWLLDWFTSTGAIVQNITLTNKYRQVAIYAYVMCEETYTVRRDGNTFIKVGPFPSTQLRQVFCTATKKREYKSRVAASPYGFGLIWSGFSPYQLSILAALGLSRT